MDIFLRNIDENVIRKIDDMAAKKGVSRNEFLRTQIEYIALAPELISKDEKYERLVREVKESLDQNTRLIKMLVEDDL